MPRMVYLRDRLVPESEARLSLYDLSVMQGVSAFEMTRSFNGVPFKLLEHVHRLALSCETLGIAMPKPLEEIMSLCALVSEANDHGPGEEHRLSIMVSPGCAPMYAALEGVLAEPWLSIADFPLRLTTAGMGTYFTEGLAASFSGVQQVPDEAIPSTVKHRSRLHFHRAQQQAKGTWPILLTRPYGMERYVAEAPGANVMWVKDGTLYTVDRCALNGISMQTASMLIGATRRACKAYMLREADEVWLTGTPFCALPVISLDGESIGSGQIGPKYREMMGRWNRLVGLDIAEQICRWDGRV